MNFVAAFRTGSVETPLGEIWKRPGKTSPFVVILPLGRRYSASSGWALMLNQAAGTGSNVPALR